MNGILNRFETFFTVFSSNRDFLKKKIAEILHKFSEVDFKSGVNVDSLK